MQVFTVEVLTFCAGVHCKHYPSVGKPELYLHERNKILSSPSKDKERDELMMQLTAAVEEVQGIHLDISKYKLI